MTTSTAPSTGRIAAAFLAELDNEAKVTRTVLERIPADKFDYKPHDKSVTFGRLASHIAEMFGWTEATLRQDTLDFATMDYKPFEPQTSEELLAFLDEKVASAKKTIAD